MNRQIELQDGRMLGYAEYGPPSGPVVIYMHGFPACRLEPGLLAMGAVRVIAPDRPGYGLSSPAPDHSFAKFAADIAALADQLDIERFALFGISGGAPYAAITAGLLKTRVDALALISGLGPPDAPGMDRDRPALLRHFGRSPIVRKMAFESIRLALLKTKAEDYYPRLRRAFTRIEKPSRDSQVMTGEFSTELIKCWREALRSSIEGPALDSRLYNEAWPIAWSDLAMPVMVWHGAADPIVPAQIAKFYAQNLPHAQYREFPEDGHVSLIAREHHTILNWLTGTAQV